MFDQIIDITLRPNNIWKEPIIEELHSSKKWIWDRIESEKETLIGEGDNDERGGGW